MKIKYSAVCIAGLILVLTGCSSGGYPEASTVNCSGRGMEIALNELKDNEEARQAFLDKCDELASGQ
ncbi:MAG: entry exclusion lipoprotein TrbK [Burkholderiales bacterium]|nr:entry exclusion lipoprotein TrbK [Nitrosomonas sp.]MCP5275864.1 entry exclusion lipoprotein TrbK [Burkholderiales bacterium]